MEYVPEDDGVDPPMPELPEEPAAANGDDVSAAANGEAAV